MSFFDSLDLDGVTGILWQEARDAANIIQHSMARYMKSYLAQNVNSAAIEKPCTKGQTFNFCILQVFSSFKILILSFCPFDVTLRTDYRGERIDSHQRCLILDQGAHGEI